jgi:phosphate-selective porin OprO/OprP
MRKLTFKHGLAVTISALALSVATGGVALAAPKKAAAGSNANAALIQLVKDQQAKIDALEQRLSAVEAKAAAPAVPAETQEAVQASAQAVETHTAEIQAVQAQILQLQDGQQGAVKVKWTDGGPEFTSGDGFFTFHPRGRVQIDASTTRGSNFDARNISGTEAASLRLGAEGSMGKLGYKVEADFADEVVSIKEAYLSYDSTLFGHKTEYYLGNKLNDRTIDGSTSGVSLPFMERSVVANVVAPQKGFFGLGVMTKVYGDSWHASVSLTGGPISQAGTDRSPLTLAGRAHWNPVKTKDGFVHLGVWGFSEDLAPTTATINKTSYIGPGFNDNLKVSASSLANPEHDNGYGYELGGAKGSFWAFAEYGVRDISLQVGPNVKQKAASVYAGYLLTGERPGFSTRSGIWSGVHVTRPFTAGGPGAFEVTSRYDKIDFTDVANGGEGDAVTVGLNWYLNDWARLMTNYVHWTTENKVGSFKGKDTGDSLSLRGEVAF